MARQKQREGREKKRTKKAAKPEPVEEKKAASGWRRSGFKASSTVRRERGMG